MVLLEWRYIEHESHDRDSEDEPYKRSAEEYRIEDIVKIRYTRNANRNIILDSVHVIYNKKKATLEDIEKFIEMIPDEVHMPEIAKIYDQCKRWKSKKLNKDKNDPWRCLIREKKKETRRP